MPAYLSRMDRRVRFARFRARAFEIYISSLPDLRGWCVYGIGAAVIFLMLIAGTWD